MYILNWIYACKRNNKFSFPVAIIQENEEVVEHALCHVEDDFDLIHCFRDWKRRGNSSFVTGNYDYVTLLHYHLYRELLCAHE